jgi:predicted flavoprotein YhiN
MVHAGFALPVGNPFQRRMLSNRGTSIRIYSRWNHFDLTARGSIFVEGSSWSLLSARNDNQQQQKVHRLSQDTKTKRKIAVVGGGASGIFAAIHAAAADPQRLEITVFEATSNLLSKVKISGGGRCNVLHDRTWTPDQLLGKGYPRGQKELRGIFTQQYPIERAAQWFEAHGVALKTEADGRMFPITDSSQTVMDALLNATQQYQSVQIQMRAKVLRIIPPLDSETSYFQVTYSVPTRDGDRTAVPNRTVTTSFDAVILATGSAPAGYALIAPSASSRAPKQDADLMDDTTSAIHHPFVSTVPSLFTFNCKYAVSQAKLSDEAPHPDASLLYGLAGVSVPKVRISFIPPPETVAASLDDQGNPRKKEKKKKLPPYLTQEGPILITHHGLSGPAVLRLSAFGARDLHAANYRGTLLVHWIPDCCSTPSDCLDRLWSMTSSNPKKMIASQCPILLSSTNAVESDLSTPSNGTPAIPKRLWSSLVVASGISETLCWGQASKAHIRTLSERITSCTIEMTSKSTNKEEFVTAGGVSLGALHMKTMQSKTLPGLFFCGEVINVDGITGGFNFYNCWSTGYVAGTSAAAFVLNQKSMDEEL